NSSATIELVNAGVGDDVTRFALSDVSSTASITFQILQGTLTANQVSDAGIVIRQAASYQAAPHRFLRFRFDETDGGTVHWDTSADCTNFVELASAPTSPWMQSTYVQLYAGSNLYPPGDDAGTIALFDGLNVCRDAGTAP